MIMLKVENPWEIKSIYELQYFNCPSCSYKYESKQDFVCHAFDTHPDSVNYLRNLEDGSLDDILCPWDSNEYKLEDYKENNVTENIKVEVNDEHEYLFNAHEISSDHETKNEEVENEPIINHRKTSRPCGNVKKHHINSVVHNPNESENEYKCNICDKKFTRQFLLNRHNKHSHDKPHQCSLCEKSYGDITKLRRHIEIIHEGLKKLLCDQCDYKCGYKRSLVDHVKRHHSNIQEPENKSEEKQKAYSCDICSKSYTTKFMLKKHKWGVHEDRKTHKCESCPNSYTTASGLDYHVKVAHHGGKENYCAICDKEFDNKKSFKDHKKNEHPKKPLMCEECGKTFNFKSPLELHISIIHKKEKNYICEVENCGKTFATKGNFQTHVKRYHEVHEKVDHICDTCGTSCSTIEGLRYHIKRTHEGLRFKCDQCGKCFTSSWGMKSHVKTVHEGRKDFKCDSCNGVFSRKKSLRVHINTVHKGLKPYKCSICPVAYGQPGDLTRHTKRCHSQDRPNFL